MLLAVVGIILLTLLMGATAYNVSTVLVPERGGVFREGVAGNPQYINPLLCHTHEIDRDLCSLLFRGLTRLDQQGRVVPDLAERWTAPDGLIYTFTLRENQFWHDGKPVTIDDVAVYNRVDAKPGFTDPARLGGIVALSHCRTGR